MSSKHVTTDVDGREVVVSNLDKVLYPDSGFTKGDVMDYYARIADVMLPYLRGRPATLKRFPNGVQDEGFYEKHSPSNTPEWAATLLVPSKNQAPIEYLAVDDRATLVWAANLAAIEFHVPMWHAVKSRPLPTPPDFMVFDLDPGPGCSIVECCQVAQWISDRLETDNLFAKTSGSKGLQVYVRVKRASWDVTNEGAHELARAIESDHPERVVSTMTKALRQRKVLIDWSQNSPAKTTVAAYSLRARPEPTVSTPVTWSEVVDCAKRGEPATLRFDARQVLTRVENLGDVMAPLAPSLTKTKKASSFPGGPARVHKA